MLISEALLATSLAQHPALSKITAILDAAITAADPQKAILQHVRVEGDVLRIGNREYRGITRRRKIVLGFGKASVSMGAGILNALKGDVAGGVIISKNVTVQPGLLSPLVLLSANHPVPETQNILATQELLTWTDHLSPDDLVFCLVSGGGSALFTNPVEGVSLSDIQQMTRVLLACGAPIQDINILRKHLDQVKGGGLARRICPAGLVTLILSDVVGNSLDVIASGPTVADPTTFQDALSVIRKYSIMDRLPTSIIHRLKLGDQRRVPETVKPGDTCLESVNNVIIASNESAVTAAVERANQVGFDAHGLTSALQGEARVAGQYLARLLRVEAVGCIPGQKPRCLVVGGETTVTLRGQGKGGRNQEVALAAVEELKDVHNAALVTLATDGEDGPTDACGAVVTGDTWQRASQAGMRASDYLEVNNSYVFFDRLGDLIRTGATGTNVNDLSFLFCF